MKRMDIFDMMASTIAAIVSAELSGRPSEKEIECYLSLIQMAPLDFLEIKDIQETIHAHYNYFEELEQQFVEDYLQLIGNSMNVIQAQKAIKKINLINRILQLLKTMTKGD